MTPDAKPPPAASKLIPRPIRLSNPKDIERAHIKGIIGITSSNDPTKEPKNMKNSTIT